MVRRVMNLITECERVDSMPENEDRSEAFQILFDRIEWFEAEIANSEKSQAIEKAVEVLHIHPN